MKLTPGTIAAILGYAILCVWIAIGYVAIHFIIKFW